MYPSIWKLSAIIANLIVFWYSVIPINGNSDTNVVPLKLQKANANKELEIILNRKNDTGALPLGVLFLNNKIGSVHINSVPNYSHTITNVTQSEESVRSDYTLTKDIGYHKLHKQRDTWNEARKTCIKEQAQLAVINSLKEEALLLKLMRDNGFLDEAYIGVHDFYHTKEWVTITGEPLQATGFVKWSTNWPNVPDDTTGTQRCLDLHILGGLDDVDCDIPRVFFCEIPLQKRCGNGKL